MPYNNFAKHYDNILAPIERRFLNKWRKETLSYLPKDAKLLEIGAGTGNNFNFYPTCDHAIASDISCEMLQLAADKTTLIKLIQADAENLPFADHHFDAAFATLVFCSIPNPEKAFAELSRVLNNKSRIVLLEHVRPPNLLGYLFDVVSLITVALFEDHFNRETSSIAEKAGLNIIEIKRKAFGIVNLIICEVVK